MGNAAIYYYPDPATALTTVDLGENFSDIQDEPKSIGSSERSLAGRIFTRQVGGYLRVRFVLERFTSESLVRKLYALQNFLHRGGLIGVANDADKAWFAFATGEVQAGTTAIPLKVANQSYNASGSPGTDEVSISSHVPEVARELAVVSSVSSSTLTLSAGTTLRFQQQPVFLRHRHFYPFMRLSPGERERPILTHDHGYLYTLDMTLEEDFEVIRAVAEHASPVRRGTDTAAATPEQIADQLAPVTGSRMRSPAGTFGTTIGLPL